MTIVESLTLTATINGAQLSCLGEGPDVATAYCQAVQRLSVLLAEATQEDEVELFEVGGVYHRWDPVGRGWMPVSDAELEALGVERDLAARIAAAKKLIDHDRDCGARLENDPAGAHPCNCGAEMLLMLLDGKGGRAG